MAVPFIDLRRFEPGLLDEWLRRVEELTRETRFVGGPGVRDLEARLAREAGVARAVGCANGTDALQLALRAAGVGVGDVVVVPDSTFWATFEAVVNCGARVVTVDIDPTDLQMDFDGFTTAVEQHRPKAAILVHLYGWGSARLDDFRSFSRDAGLPLIEDGAQCWGSLWNGRSIYAGAFLSTVSFYPAKVLGSCGDAGAVLASSDELGDRISCLGNHGRTDHYHHGLVGWNSRLGALDAAWLDLALDHTPARLASRVRAAERYREALDARGVRSVGPPEGHRENGYLNVTLWDASERPKVETVLRERGIGFGNVYPGAMSDQPAAPDFLAGRVGGHAARDLARSVLNLPLFAGITDAEISEVLDAVDAARKALDTGSSR